MVARQKRKERITRTRQKQILDAALAVFSAQGFGEATMAAIAAEAGIGVGTIYNYYRDKHDLLISLVGRSLMSDDLLKILGSTRPRTGEQLMQSLLEERLSFGLDNAHKMLFLFFEIQRDHKLRTHYVAQVISPLLARTEKYVADQIAAGNFRHVDPRVIARTLAASIIGNMILYQLEQRNSPFKKSRIRETAGELRDLFIHGLEAK
jgi:AcrR family transcriptional regulator